MKKRRLAREKDINEFSLIGTIGLVSSIIPIVYFCQPISPLLDHYTKNSLYIIIFSIIILLSFFRFVIGTLIAKIKKYDSNKIIMYSLGIIINGFWTILLIFDSTRVRIFVILIISFFIFLSKKLSPTEEEIMLKRKKNKMKMNKKNNKNI